MGNPTAAPRPQQPPVAPAPPSATQTTPARKTRVVISQDPTPLYCSDECRARDLKNSFIESDSAGFAGASAARDSVAQFELVRQTVERRMQGRRAAVSDEKPPTPKEAYPLPILSPIQLQQQAPDAATDVPDPQIPPAPPNSLVDPPPPLYRTTSLVSSSSASSTSSAPLHAAASKDNTIRAPKSRSRPPLPVRSGSFSTWGSPTKAALAPPARTLFNASSSSIDSSVSSAGSALFDDDAIVIAEKGDSVDTCSTTPSRRGSGSSGESKKKQKRVSFASDSKPSTLVEPSPATDPVKTKRQPRLAKVSPVKAGGDWRRRRRNLFLDANPLRDAVSVSPKDRVKAASLPSDALPPAAYGNGTGTPTPSSRSTPALCPQVVDTPSPSRRQRYSVAMWPEDEKRTTESARVHGELLRGYAKRFGPREGRSLVWGRLWAGSEADAEYRAMSTSPSAGSATHEMQPDSRRDYWRVYEEREAEVRARRKAEAAVQRLEEERVICELLGGAGMREEDQPQARRMKRMAYDGMPGPAELRGLTYKFDRFLYPLMPPKPTIVEKTVRRFDEQRGEWVEEVMREEVFERKKLFNFLED